MAKESKESKAGKGKSIIIILLALILIGVVSFGATYMLTQEKGEAKEKVVKEGFYDIGEIMVNLRDEGAKRYLKTTVSISYDVENKNLATELEEKKVAVRDATIYYFKTKTTKDFQAENEVIVKKGLVDKINGILKEGQIIDVKFADLITQ